MNALSELRCDLFVRKHQAPRAIAGSEALGLNLVVRFRLRIRSAVRCPGCGSKSADKSSSLGTKSSSTLKGRNNTAGGPSSTAGNNGGARGFDRTGNDDDDRDPELEPAGFRP